jgi:hypothetical protein
VEGEDVIGLDVESDLLPGGRRLPSFGACYHCVPALGQAHVQQGVGTELLDEDHIAGQFPGSVGQVHVLRPDAEDKLGQARGLGRPGDRAWQWQNGAG